MKKDILLTVILILTLTGISAAQSVDEIIKKADSLFTGDKVYSLSTMTIYNSGSPTAVQTIESYSMEQRGVSQTLTVYRAPKRMQGTAYLMIDNDLWVRFGTTGRVRKMSSSARTNSAGGSDFSYADMGEGSRGISFQYSTSLDGEETIDGKGCYKIILQPKAGFDAPYEKLIAFIEKDTYRYIQVDYFDKGANIKTLYLQDYRETGSISYPYLVIMESKVKPSKTEIITDEIVLNSPKVTERLFTVNYLKSIR